MYVVLAAPFDPECNTVYGPFVSQDHAKRWRDTQPDREWLVIERLYSPPEKMKRED